MEVDEKNTSIIVGPWGGHGGASWDDGCYNGVREITLVYALCIDSIRVVYDNNGKPFSAQKHGGTGGTKTAEIKLQFPEEFLTSVSGHTCPVVHGGSPVIRSITFKSNRRTFGPYGVQEGTPFYFTMERGQIVGFKGRGGWYLDAIGFYITPVYYTSPVQTTTTTAYQKVQHQFRRLTSSISFAARDGQENRSKATKTPAKMSV